MWSKIFEILSFLVLITSVAFFILGKDESGRINDVFLLMLLLAIVLKMLGLQFKCNALKKENRNLKKEIKNEASQSDPKSKTN